MKIIFVRRRWILLWREKRGEALIEALIAITIIVVGLLGMYSLLSRSLSLTRVVTDRYVAANLASEGIEVVKNIIDTNDVELKPWNQNLSSKGDYEVAYNSVELGPFLGRNLFYNLATGLYSYDVLGTRTNFVRKIILEPINSEEIKVNSIVSWLSRGGAVFEINLEDHFFNSK